MTSAPAPAGAPGGAGTPGPVARQLLVASRGTWSGPGADRVLADAGALAATGAVVTVALVADAVTYAVPAVRPALTALTGAGGAVLVDRLSARQRGLDEYPLPARVRWSEPDDLARLVLDPAVAVVWR